MSKRNEVFLDLQQFAEGDASGDDSNAGDGAVDGSKDVVKLSGKFKEIIDPVSKKSVKIPVEFDAVLGHFISSTRTNVEQQFKPLLEKISGENTELKDIKSEYDRLKEQSMSAEERAQSNAKKVIQEHEKTAKAASEEAATWKTRFERSTVRNDIFASFGDIKLCNPGQVALLFEDEGRAKVAEVIDEDGKSTGAFETRMTLTLENDKGESEKIEGTPAELFKKWIKMDRNLHHVQNDIAPGAGARPNKSMAGKIDPNLSPVERMNQFRLQQTNK